MTIHFRRLNLNIIIKINYISKLFSIFTSSFNKYLRFITTTADN